MCLPLRGQKNNIPGGVISARMIQKQNKTKPIPFYRKLHRRAGGCFVCLFSLIGHLETPRELVRCCKKQTHHYFLSRLTYVIHDGPFVWLVGTMVV